MSFAYIIQAHRIAVTTSVLALRFIWYFDRPNHCDSGVPAQFTIAIKSVIWGAIKLNMFSLVNPQPLRFIIVCTHLHRIDTEYKMLPHPQNACHCRRAPSNIIIYSHSLHFWLVWCLTPLFTLSFSLWYLTRFYSSPKPVSAVKCDADSNNAKEKGKFRAGWLWVARWWTTT